MYCSCGVKTGRNLEWIYCMLMVSENSLFCIYRLPFNVIYEHMLVKFCIFVIDFVFFLFCFFSDLFWLPSLHMNLLWASFGKDAFCKKKYNFPPGNCNNFDPVLHEYHGTVTDMKRDNSCQQ